MHDPDDELDISIFDRIPTQTTPEDRRSLLAAQRATARHFGHYCYLEIGSHLGGSIQPHLLDARCRRIYSIDPRPPAQPDNRGGLYGYEGNSTERMVENLRAIAGSLALERLETIEAAAPRVDPARIDDPPHLCFIDGEHTTEAVLADFAFCHRVRHPDGTICLHDAGVVWGAVRRIWRFLRAEEVPVEPLVLGGSVVAFAFGRSPLPGDPAVSRLRRSPAVFFMRSAVVDFKRRGAAALGTRRAA